MFSSMLSLLGSLRSGSSFITNSLRFRSSASASFTRTPSVAGNRKTWTLSAWIKKGAPTSGFSLFDQYTDTNNQSLLKIRDSAASDADRIRFYDLAANVFNANIYWTPVYRDYSAWYHIVLVADTTQAVNTDRVKLYINGVQITSTASAVWPSQNTDLRFNLNSPHFIGQNGIGSEYTDGYIADFNFIDGQALTPSSFGQIESTTGVWSPKQYVGSYGTNGFYLKFANTSSVAALGNDSSGNNNTWTVNNVSLTAGATYDSMIDVPVNYSDSGNGRGNYAVLNPLARLSTSSSFTNGNLNASGTDATAIGNIAVTSGKWYAECIYSSAKAGDNIVGVQSLHIFESNNAPAPIRTTGSVGYDSIGGTTSKVVDNVFSSYGASWTSNDVIGVALDLDNNQITFYKNGVSQGVINYTFSSYGPWTFANGIGSAPASIAFSWNFGQRSFQFPVPAGFRALNTNNLPTPSIVNGANFMAATTYTGNAAARSLSNAVNSVSFQPDLVWIKSRTPGATNHALFDSVRGTTKYLSSNTTTGETTLAQSLTAFSADGFSLGTDTTLVNANANSYVAWQWKAGGAAVSNTQGTITSQVSANTTAGLSVVTYTGTGVNATVGHGLGVAPKMIIIKRRGTAGYGWIVGHTSIGWGNILYLTSTNGSGSATAVFQSTAPSSSIVTLGTDTYVNDSTAGNTYVAYCFAEIAGFSRFGSYTGNGLADGPFVFCGFRPRWVMIKRTDASGSNWRILDTSRDTFNIESAELYPSLPNAEVSYPSLDGVSNGFKIRNADIAYNASGGTYIFAAFAEVPSKYALAR